jgi:oligopeptide/dipeptide ABC transporter ATP-binding protein
MTALLSVLAIGKQFGGRRVLDDVSCEVGRGEVVALVGESGSGKSTLGRIISGLERADTGNILLDGAGLRGSDTRAQLVFQDPFSSLNPVHTVAHHLARPLARRTRQPVADVAAESARLLEAVGLDGALAARHPHALSGGQRQRVAIARALAAGPELIVADEPTSMLDVSTRLGVLQLLRRLADERKLGILLITHDLASAAAIADRVLTLYAGRIVESGTRDAVLLAPAHPYTRLLLASAPRGEPLTPADAAAMARDTAASSGDAAAIAQGCAFFPRCTSALARCHELAPAPRPSAAGHQVRCHLYPEGASEHVALS